LVALSGRSADCVARSGSGRKADMPNQRVECPLMTKKGHEAAQLVPNAKHVTNTNSGHEIHKERPQLVMDSIREVVEAVRSGSRQLAR
jgi:hypothetical protein